MTASHLQQALARGKPVWGGWITGPTSIGPEEFARAGYDYVGFDAQHGYLDDADIANILRRLEHVPIGTAVRLPSADPAPIGRVLDAGADAIIIAMIESADQAAAAVAATRYPPAGVRSFGPLRASLGYDTAALESRVSVFAMIETAAIADIERAASAAGLVPGIHAGDGNVGHVMAQLGFRMITLASESQALRRGAAAGLKEATAQDAPTEGSAAGGYQ
jgi:4-hydroxy-2-oxoheptanedioate aldolase